MTIISPLPFTLTNDTAADASQVMANLNQIRNDVNNNASGGGGSGNVVGPASAIDGHVAVFDGPTGKILRDGGPLGAGSFVLLDTQTAATSNLEFTSILDETLYSGYAIVMDSLILPSSEGLVLNSSTDNGSSWTGACFYTLMTFDLGSGSGPTYGGAPVAFSMSLTGTPTSSTLNGRIDFVHTSTGSMQVNSNIGNATVPGNIYTQVVGQIGAGINALQLAASSTTIASGVAYLYGIKR